MRIRSAVLVAVLAGMLGAAVAGGTSAARAFTPVNSYRWAQPGTASVANADAQLPTRISVAMSTVHAYVPVSGYRWAQPGTSPVANAYGLPPAWIFGSR